MDGWTFVARSRRPGLDRSEGFGERLLGQLLDRAHQMPPHLIAPLVAEEVHAIGGRDVTILLQDYGQELLVPLPGLGLTVCDPLLIDSGTAGEAFRRAVPVERPVSGGIEVALPLLDGSDEIGVMVVTFDDIDDDDRRLLRRLSGLVAEMLVTKAGYTDRFFQARRRAPMSVAGEIQCALLPPMTMENPQVAVAGIMEPPYRAAGDSFDYALNDDILHFAMFDAMGHGLNAAMLATLTVSAYRHARRSDVGIGELYTRLDTAVEEQFGRDHFVTAQMGRLCLGTGRVEWVNAGHPAPLLIRDHRVVGHLEGPGTVPIGVGGAVPRVNSADLRPGDRVLLYTDGLIEEHVPGGEIFGEDRLLRTVERVGPGCLGVHELVRALSHTLLRDRGGVTSDDASIFLIEWRGGPSDALAGRGGMSDRGTSVDFRSLAPLEDAVSAELTRIRRPTKWRELVAESCPEAVFGPPVEEGALAAVEAGLGQPVPAALVQLLRECDGVKGPCGLEVVWNAERIRRTNARMRSGHDFADLYMPFDPLMFFGGNGDGDLFAFVRMPERDDVFVWDHVTDARRWADPRLEQYLRLALHGRTDW